MVCLRDNLWIVAFITCIVRILHILVELNRLLANGMLLVYCVLRHFRPLSSNIIFLWRMLLHLVHGVIVLLCFDSTMLFG